MSRRYDRSYYANREESERAAALQSRHPAVRLAHERFALLYRGAVEAIEALEPGDAAGAEDASSGDIRT